MSDPTDAQAYVLMDPNAAPDSQAHYACRVFGWIMLYAHSSWKYHISYSGREALKRWEAMNSNQRLTKNQPVLIWAGYLDWQILYGRFLGYGGLTDQHCLVELEGSRKCMYLMQWRVVPTCADASWPAEAPQ